MLPKEIHPYRPWIVPCGCSPLECNCNCDHAIETRMQQEGIDVQLFNESVVESHKLGYLDGYAEKVLRGIEDSGSLLPLRCDNEECKGRETEQSLCACGNWFCNHCGDHIESSRDKDGKICWAGAA